MVTSEEIKRRLEAKRKGISPSLGRKGPKKSETTTEEIKRRLDYRRRGVEPPSDKESLQGETCPHCKTINPPEAKFCVGCGETLKEERSMSVPSKTIETDSFEAETTPSKDPLSTNQAEYKICPACKQKNKEESKFCVICGNKLELDTGSGESTRSEDIDQKMSEIRNPVHLQSKETEFADLETEETSPKTVPPISSDRESNTLLKSELESRNNYENAETVVPSVSKRKTGKSGVLSENVDPVEKIRKAKELLDIGAITQEEFEQIKNKYLEQI
jgi:RNA polymerase subunit RPABC4/transcription elongation factor Spt4